MFRASSGLIVLYDQDEFFLTGVLYLTPRGIGTHELFESIKYLITKKQTVVMKSYYFIELQGMFLINPNKPFTS